MILSRNNSILVTVFAALLCNGIAAQFSGHPRDSRRTVRVMVHKEFKLQPDGTYKEISSGSGKKVSLSPVSSINNYHEQEAVQAESAPSMQYAYRPYHYYSDNQAQPSEPMLRFTNDDVQDVMRQLAQQYTYNPKVQSTYTYAQPGSQTQVNYTASASAPSSRRYPKFEIKQAASQSYFLDQGNFRPASGYSASPVQTGGRSGYSRSSPVTTVSKYGPPNSIQEILKKPEQSSATQNNHYYSPKENSYNYAATGPSGYSNGPAGGGGYGAPTGGYNAPSSGYSGPTGPTGYSPPSSHSAPSGPASYGPPANTHSQWSNSYSDVKHGGQGGLGGIGALGHGAADAVGGVVNSLVKTVSGVGQAKAAQFSSALHQKGELGQQIFKQGGEVVNSAVHQKAQAAKFIGDTLSQAPARFSHILRTKADLASGFIDQGSKAFGSVVQVKAQAAHQASELISAKGKAATAVIKASGGTAADLIVAKGKGIANLITSSGHVASSLLNHKGNSVHKIAEVIGGVTQQLHGAKGALRGGGGHGGGHGGYQGGGGGGWSNDDGISGGYSENQDQYNRQSYENTAPTYQNAAPTYQNAAPSYENAPSRVYDELQDALKTVVQSPASSYGQPPSQQDEGHTKLNSAFRSIYDNFKAGQNQPSYFPLGSYSTNVEVTARPDTSIVQTASTIGESLNKMSKMLNNVASAINWLTPNKKQP